MTRVEFEKKFKKETDAALKTLVDEIGTTATTLEEARAFLKTNGTIAKVIPFDFNCEADAEQFEEMCDFVAEDIVAELTIKTL